jgi:phosphoesterase RecJ-like protein
MAIALMAEGLGKSVSIINADKTPSPFSLFPEFKRITVGQIDPSLFDTVILLECADVSRSGQENLGSVFKVNIDHHHSHTLYGDINWIDPEAAAVGEMAFVLSESLGVRLSPEVADHLYCAIVSDTGSFQFSNTSPRALEVCARLARLGASPIRVSDRLFHNNPPEKILLLSRVLSTLRLNGRGNIAVISMSRQDLASLHIEAIDTEDITTLARSIRDVEMVLFFKELEKETWRISVRSKGRANAALVAERFGGGGHVHASGFTVYGAFEKLVREIPAAVEKLLDQAAGEGPLPAR